MKSIGINFPLTRNNNGYFNPTNLSKDIVKTNIISYLSLKYNLLPFHSNLLFLNLLKLLFLILTFDNLKLILLIVKNKLLNKFSNLDIKNFNLNLLNDNNKINVLIYLSYYDNYTKLDELIILKREM